MSETAIYRSPLRYPGGKQKAMRNIARMLPSQLLSGYIKEYREPMAGGASVYFYVRSRGLARSYWINDQFRELVSFWQAVQDPDTCGKLVGHLRELRNTLSSAEEVKEYFLSARKKIPDSHFDEALFFFFFNRVTFSGTTRAGGFSSSASMKRFTESSITKLCTMPEALADTNISNVDFEEVVNAPGKDVFLFLDPPYFTANRLYGPKGSLHEFDHERLAKSLRGCGHQFLITYDDCPDVRKLYDWAKIETWNLQYGMNNCNRNHQSKIGAELFITNY